MRLIVSSLRSTVVLPTIFTAVTIGLGASSATAQTFLERLERRINEALPLTPPAAANPRTQQGRGYLGLSAEDTETGGVRVLTVRAGSPALAAGIRPGDEIRSLDGVAVRSVDQMGEILDRLAAGTRVEFGLRRQEQSLQTLVTLGSRDVPAEPRVEIPVPPPDTLPLDQPANAGTSRPTLGVVLAPLTDTLRQKFGVTARSGALVTEVRVGGTAQAAGIGPGCVIVGLDDLHIDEPASLLAAVRERRVGDSITLSWYEGNELRRKSVALRLPSTSTPGGKPPSGTAPSGTAPSGTAPSGTAPPRAGEDIFGESPDVAGKPETLEEQVRRLTRAVELLQRRVEQLEKRLELPP